MSDVCSLACSPQLLWLQVIPATRWGRRPADPDMIARGNYLARAADCMPCHTAARDKAYAGGLRMNTPFGVMYSPNITPDRETGIGAWTFEEFKQAVHSGIRADGKFLYPTMPFDAFTKISEDDLKALWSYFRSLPPIKQQNRENELTFPFSIRYGMLVWRALFFRAQWFEPDPTKSAQWNQGAYLVEALGHCGDCHTPRNFMGATVASERFKGAQIDQWYAPNITPEALARTNRWDKSQLIAFLKKGAANNSTALGPMQEVVHDSLSFLTPDDLDAMASYLLDVTNGSSAPALVAAKKLPPEIAARGRQVVRGQLCDLPSGKRPGCCRLDPATRRQSGGDRNQAFRHALRGPARRSCARRYPGNAEFCGIAERQRCCRSRQLRAHELG